MAGYVYNINDPTTWGAFTDVCSRPMGLGLLGLPGITFKRKYRWTMGIQYCVGTIGSSGQSATVQTVAEEYVKMASRPQIDIEESEINYLHGKMFIPGKATFQTMNVTYYDIAGTSTLEEIVDSPYTNCSPTEFEELLISSGGTTSVFAWIASIYNIYDLCNLEMGSNQGQYSGSGLLRLYDGCGKTLEVWLLTNMWPTSVNFGELDMGSSDECTIELTLRYTGASYRSLCPPQTSNRCTACTPCGGDCEE